MAVTNTVFERNKAQFQGLFTEMWTASATIDPASIAAGAVASESVTVSGVALGDMVLGWSAGVDLTDDLDVRVTISAANTLKVHLVNDSAAAIDLGTSTWRFLVGRPLSA